MRKVWRSEEEQNKVGVGESELGLEGSGVWARLERSALQLQEEAGIACVTLGQFLMLWCSAKGLNFGKGWRTGAL